MFSQVRSVELTAFCQQKNKLSRTRSLMDRFLSSKWLYPKGRMKGLEYVFSTVFLLSRGKGDLHDRRRNNYARTVTLNGPGQYSSSSPIFTLSVYPNDGLFAVYETNNPVTATVGSVCIILFTSILFFLYDFFLWTELHHKESMSKARRQFVRFVSHEVRT